MPFRWLAEDDSHPVRPDLPVVRHLTFTEVHSLELGVYVGLFAFFATQFGYGGEVVMLLFGIIRFVMSDGRAKAGATMANHRLGFHDVRQEPPYFGSGFLLAFGLAFVGTRAWSVLGIGPIA